MKIFFSLLYISIAILALVPTGAFSQVTIGSTEAPSKGALLDLKENLNGTSNKGLMLPRLELAANNILTIASGAASNSDYIGAVVYNTTKIETSEADRLCPGVHVWTGSKWQPLVLYPINTIPPSLAGPEADLVDSRDGETYHTARFHSVKAGNPYSCTSVEVVIIDAGIWMTQNLRYTQGLTNSPADTYIAMQYYTPSNTGATAARIRENGKLYNWAAASSQKGNTTTGQGNVDNPPAYDANNEGYNQAGATTEVRRQGVCPPGWHLPTDTEWYILTEALKLRPDLYSSQTTATDANAGNVMKNSTEAAGAYLGTSKPSDQGGFAGYLVGFANQNRVTGYGVSNHWWASSSYNGANSWKRRVDNSTSSIDWSPSSRNNHFSVRCKKD
jgi:uncharacterized protein (TIGR02145 family)